MKVNDEKTNKQSKNAALEHDKRTEINFKNFRSYVSVIRRLVGWLVLFSSAQSNNKNNTEMTGNLCKFARIDALFIFLLSNYIDRVFPFVFGGVGTHFSPLYVLNIWVYFHSDIECTFLYHFMISIRKRTCTWCIYIF